MLKADKGGKIEKRYSYKKYGGQINRRNLFSSIEAEFSDDIMANTRPGDVNKMYTIAHAIKYISAKSCDEEKVLMVSILDHISLYIELHNGY